MYLGCDRASGRQVAAPSPAVPSSSDGCDGGGDGRFAAAAQHDQRGEGGAADRDAGRGPRQAHHGAAQVVAHLVHHAGQPDRVGRQRPRALLVDPLERDVQAQRAVVGVDAQRARAGARRPRRRRRWAGRRGWRRTARWARRRGRRAATATTAPTRATTTRRAQRPATRPRRRHGDGGAAVGSVPVVPASLGSLTPTTLSSGGDSCRAEDPAQCREPHQADGRGDRRRRR